MTRLHELADKRGDEKACMEVRRQAASDRGVRLRDGFTLTEFRSAVKSRFKWLTGPGFADVNPAVVAWQEEHPPFTGVHSHGHHTDGPVGWHEHMHEHGADNAHVHPHPDGPYGGAATGPDVGNEDLSGDDSQQPDLLLDKKMKAKDAIRRAQYKAMQYAMEFDDRKDDE